ncbi:MAG: hypothetical protein ACXWQ5_18320 [Ktedonobacterales bacterium]
MGDSTERDQQPQQRPWWKTSWSEAFSVLDAQAAARDQARRDRLARHEAMIRRTNMLAAMTAEEREAYWRAEAGESEEE